MNYITCKGFIWRLLPPSINSWKCQLGILSLDLCEQRKIWICQNSLSEQVERSPHLWWEMRKMGPIHPDAAYICNSRLACLQWRHSFTPVSICWLRTRRRRSGTIRIGFRMILFLTQTSSSPPQHNLFTARRWSVGSAHLPHWNNCCDDRLYWEHGQACENKHRSWLEVLECEPSRRARHRHISPVQSFRLSDQFSLCALRTRTSRGFHGVFFCFFLTEVSRPLLRVVSKGCTAGSKHSCFDGAQHPDMIIRNTVRWIHFHSGSLSAADNTLGRKNVYICTLSVVFFLFLDESSEKPGVMHFAILAVGLVTLKNQVVIMITDGHCISLHRQGGTSTAEATPKNTRMKTSKHQWWCRNAATGDAWHHCHQCNANSSSV